MAEYEGYLLDIADAIRSKDGTSDNIPAYEFPARIAALSQGNQIADLSQYELTAAQFEAIPAAQRENTMLIMIANAIRAKEGSVDPIAANLFADRIRGLASQSPSRLPEGYTEVEYIRKYNQYLPVAYISTGEEIGDFSTYRLTIDLAMSDDQKYSVASNYILSAPEINSRYFWMRWTSKKRIEYRISTYAYNYINLTDTIAGKRIIIDFDCANKTLKIGDYSTKFEIQFTLASIPNIFGTSGSHVNADLYSFQIYRSGMLISDAVPCISPANELGVYDLIKGTFTAVYDSLANVEGQQPVFTAGPTV